MRYRSNLQSDKMRQDLELRNLGLKSAKSGHWQEVFFVAFVVVALGLFLISFLDLSPTIWKFTTFALAVVGSIVGIIYRKKLLDRQAARSAEEQKYAAREREYEVQRQLTEMRKNKETATADDGVKNV